jgi:hypothetical protein
MGIKIPLMKTSGNLIREDSIIMVAGTSVGGYADMSTPRDAKQNAPAVIPSPSNSGLAISTPRNKPMITGNTEIIAPKRKDESMSPTKIVQIETGQDTSLSRVFDLASQGTIAGPTELAVKKTVIPSNPGMRASRVVFRPI